MLYLAQLASELVYSIQDIIAVKNIICFIHWEELDVFFEKVLKNVFETLKIFSNLYNFG